MASIDSTWKGLRLAGSHPPKATENRRELMAVTVIGYTHSGGYALCPKHAEYGNMRDEGNETGYVFPIFATDETDSDISCDVDLNVILAKNTCDEEADDD
jgi:hypothetical protein